MGATREVQQHQMEEGLRNHYKVATMSMIDYLLVLVIDAERCRDMGCFIGSQYIICLDVCQILPAYM